MKNAGIGIVGIVVLFAICFVVFHADTPPSDTDVNIEDSVELVSEAESNEAFARATLKTMKTARIMEAKGVSFGTDKAIVAAVSPATAHRGYYYAQNHTIAIPAEYGKSATLTFALSKSGSVIWKDMKGAVITEIPADLSDWESED